MKIALKGIDSLDQLDVLANYNVTLGEYSLLTWKSIESSKQFFQRVILCFNNALDLSKYSLKEVPFSIFFFRYGIFANNIELYEKVANSYLRLYNEEPPVNPFDYAYLQASILLKNNSYLIKLFNTDFLKHCNIYEKGELLFYRALYEQDESQMLEALKIMCKHSDKIQPLNSFQMVFPPEINALVMLARKRGFTINYKHALIHDDFINDPFIPEPDEYFIPYIKSWNLIGMMRAHKKYLK